MHQENSPAGELRTGMTMPRSLPDHQPALVVVTGIMAAGKSTIAHFLAQSFARGVHVEADKLHHMIVSGAVWMKEPAEPSGEAAQQLRLRIKNMCLLGRSFLQVGFIVILDDIIFQNSRE